MSWIDEFLNIWFGSMGGYSGSNYSFPSGIDNPSKHLFRWTVAFQLSGNDGVGSTIVWADTESNVLMIAADKLKVILGPAINRITRVDCQRAPETEIAFLEKASPWAFSGLAPDLIVGNPSGTSWLSEIVSLEKVSPSSTPKQGSKESSTKPAPEPVSLEKPKKPKRKVLF